MKCFLIESNPVCHPGQAMVDSDSVSTHRAEPGSILQAARWIPDSRYAASGMTSSGKFDHDQLQKMKKRRSPAMTFGKWTCGQHIASGRRHGTELPIRCPYGFLPLRARMSAARLLQAINGDFDYNAG
ncbi:MAG TPA: hypothetical protein VJQ06_08615 [Rhizomicrobium sp.]|nr:hypothetical protein [Rhizomicrobium sp.]